MYVERIPNRNSPPAILLRESYRQGDKFKRRTLANLSDWPAAKIEALRRVLREEAVVPADQQALRLVRSLPHGHVAAALGMLRKLGLDRCVGSGIAAPSRGAEIGIALVSPGGHAMKLPRRTFLHLAAGAAVLPVLSRIAFAQSYPARPVRFVHGFAAGGSGDIAAR